MRQEVKQDTSIMHLHGMVLPDNQGPGARSELLLELQPSRPSLTDLVSNLTEGLEESSQTSVLVMALQQRALTRRRRDEPRVPAASVIDPGTLAGQSVSILASTR